MVIGGHDGVVLVDAAMTFDVIQYQKAFATCTFRVIIWFNFVNSYYTMLYNMYWQEQYEY
jgi:hypothetical protein